MIRFSDISMSNIYNQSWTQSLNKRESINVLLITITMINQVDSFNENSCCFGSLLRNKLVG